MRRLISALILAALMAGSAYAASIPLFTGPAGTNPMSEYPPNVSTMNTLINTMNSSITPQSMAPNNNFRNLLDNGAFQIYQRGTTAVTGINTTATYHADRWAGYANNGAASVSLTNITASLPLGFANAEQVQRAAANANTTAIFLVQEIPTVDTISMQQQQSCVSFYALAGANFSAASSQVTVQVITGTGTDQGLASLIAGTWTGQATTLNQLVTINATTFARYTPAALCFAMPSGATEAAVQIGFVPVGTAGANDWVQVTGVQFEPAFAPSPFEFRPNGLELVKVQRYFWQINEANSFFAAAANCTATNTITESFPTPVQMFKTPTSAITVGGFQVVIAGAAAAGQTGSAAATSNANSVNITATNTCTAGNTVMLRGSGTTGKITATADF